MVPRAAPPRIVIERSLAGRELALVSEALAGNPWSLVADFDTWQALGERVAAGLPSARTIILEKAPKPTVENVERLVSESAGSAALVAVGSGTINDLVKMAASRLGTSYVVFPTAPSMNGYGSANASIIDAGWRVSRSAVAPAAIFCDLEKIAAAPLRLIAAGLGDTLCRASVQADWLLAHYLLDEPYDGDALAPVIATESGLRRQAGGLASRGLGAVEALMRALLASGEAMRQMGSSVSASQGEHMIAHTLAMLGQDRGLHGEQIAVTTMTMLGRQETLLPRPTVTIAPDIDPDEMAAAFGDELARQLAAVYAEKRRRIEAVIRRGDWAERWNRARAAIAGVLPPITEIEQALKTVQAPTTPDGIGWSAADYTRAVRLAPYTRERFTFLDLAD